MKTRPRELSSLAMILVGIAASFPIQIMWLFGDSPLEPAAIVNKLTPLNWVVIGLACSLVPIALRASPMFWVAAPAFLGSLIWNNWLVASVYGDTWISPVHFSTAGMLLIFLGVLASPSSRRVLMSPKSRWWLTPSRRRARLDARLCPALGGEMNSTTFDISENGVFISLDESRWLGSRFRSQEVLKKGLEVGSYCWVRVALNDISALSCTAEIVRKSDPKGAYPEGIGLRFVALTAKEKKVLNSFLKTLDGPKALDAVVSSNAA